MHSGESLADAGDNLGCNNLKGFFAWLGTAEEGLHHLFEVVELAEALVVAHEFCGLIVGEPVALVVLDLGEELGIELRVVDGRRGIDGTVDANAEEAARVKRSTAVRTRERILFIGCEVFEVMRFLRL